MSLLMITTRKFPKADDYYQSGEYWNGREDADSTFKVNIVIHALEKFKIDIINGVRAAEIGCGQGAFLFPFARYLSDNNIPFKLDGYDIASNAIQLAKKRNNYPDSIEFYTGSAKDISYGYDLILCLDVIEHVENARQFLIELSGRSEYVLLHLPIEHSIAHLIFNYPKLTHGLYRHIQFYSWETAKILINDSPFKIVDYQFTGSINDPNFFKYGTTIQRYFRKVRYILYKISPETFAAIMGGPVLFCLRNRR